MPHRKRIACCIAIALLLSAGVAAAQMTGEDWTALQELRADIQTDRQHVVAANMTLSTTESEPFWALYRDYHLQIDKLGDRSAKLVADYAQKYDQMTDADANAFFKEWMAIEADRGKLRNDYSKKFIKIVGAKKAARYFQIENKLDAVINVGLAAEIPLMK